MPTAWPSSSRYSHGHKAMNWKHIPAHGKHPRYYQAGGYKIVQRSKNRWQVFHHDILKHQETSISKAKEWCSRFGFKSLTIEDLIAEFEYAVSKSSRVVVSPRSCARIAKLLRRELGNSH